MDYVPMVTLRATLRAEHGVYGEAAKLAERASEPAQSAKATHWDRLPAVKIVSPYGKWEQ